MCCCLVCAQFSYNWVHDCPTIARPYMLNAFCQQLLISLDVLDRRSPGAMVSCHLFSISSSEFGLSLTLYHHIVRICCVWILKGWGGGHHRYLSICAWNVFIVYSNYQSTMMLRVSSVSTVFILSHSCFLCCIDFQLGLGMKWMYSWQLYTMVLLSVQWLHIFCS